MTWQQINLRNHKALYIPGKPRSSSTRSPEHGTLLMLIKDGEYSRYVALRMEK